MLGYSSIAQMGLMMLALALLHRFGATASLPLVVGGLFFNHLFAKAGLFWLAGAVERPEVGGWSAVAGRPLVLLVLALLLVAIAGLPPFPGFWAKWELVMQLSGAQNCTSPSASSSSDRCWRQPTCSAGSSRRPARPRPSRRSISTSFAMLPPRRLRRAFGWGRLCCGEHGRCGFVVAVRATVRRRCALCARPAARPGEMHSDAVGRPWSSPRG